MIDDLRRSREALDAELGRAGAKLRDGMFCCPFHPDKHPSAERRQGKDGVWRFRCFAASCGFSGDIFDVRGKVENKPLADVLREAGGQTPKAAPAVRPVHRPSDKPKGGGRIVTTYDYRDAGGRLVYQVVRFEPKDFRQRRPDGKGGWTWNMNGVGRVLYRLPEPAADPSGWVFIVEGEKDVDNLIGLGLAATCNPGGAGKWSKVADTSVLDGRRVAIIPDRDAPGEAHAKDVAARLDGRAAVVKLIELPDDEAGGRRVKDVSDWIEWLDGRSPKSHTWYRTNHASVPRLGGVRRSGFARFGQRVVARFRRADELDAAVSLQGVDFALRRGVRAAELLGEARHAEAFAATDQRHDLVLPLDCWVL